MTDRERHVAKEIIKLYSGLDAPIIYFPSWTVADLVQAFFEDDENAAEIILRRVEYRYGELNCEDNLDTDILEVISDRQKVEHLLAFINPYEGDIEKDVDKIEKSLKA